MVTTATVAVLRASSSEFLGGVATGGVPLSEAGFACLGLFMQQHLAGYSISDCAPTLQNTQPTKSPCLSSYAALSWEQQRGMLSLSPSRPPPPPPLPTPASSSASFLLPKLRRW